MQNDSIKYVCEYLTGKITKDDFVSEYKKQVTSSFDESFSDNRHLAKVVQDVLRDGGKNLKSYAQENDFDARLRLDLRIVDADVCRNKLVDALLDIAYQPKPKDVRNYSRDSGFPDYNFNVGRPAERALDTFMRLPWDDGIGDLIEEKLGKSRSSIGNYETMRNNLGDCSVYNDRSLLHDISPNQR